MVFWNDVKQQWKQEDIKAYFKERWPDLLTVFIAGWLTPIVRERLGWENNFWTFLGTFLGIGIVIAIAIAVVTGLIMAIIKKISK